MHIGVVEEKLGMFLRGPTSGQGVDSVVPFRHLVLAKKSHGNNHFIYACDSCDFGGSFEDPPDFGCQVDEGHLFVVGLNGKPGGMKCAGMSLLVFDPEQWDQI